MGGHSHQSEGEHDKHAGYGWLAFCVIGMMSSLTLYGLVMEYVTSGGRKLHELSFVFVTTSIYSITAYVARSLSGEKPTNISKYQMLTLSLTSITSTFTSVRSLRYVIYPVQVLFKSCKPVPVMVFNIILGRRYPLKKYVNVIIITTGVALFMGGGKSSKATGDDTSADTMLLGVMMLSISLIADGVTGAYEDKLMSKEHVEPFDLMYNIQFGKAVISFCCLVATNGLNDFLGTIHDGGIPLVVLGFTGAIGQVRESFPLHCRFLVIPVFSVVFFYLGFYLYHYFEVWCFKLCLNWTVP
jgi:UDP-galactose transporter B1